MIFLLIWEKHNIKSSHFKIANASTAYKIWSDVYKFAKENLKTRIWMGKKIQTNAKFTLLFYGKLDDILFVIAKVCVCKYKSLQ